MGICHGEKYMSRTNQVALSIGIPIIHFGHEEKERERYIYTYNGNIMVYN